MAELFAILRSLPAILEALKALGKFLREKFGDNPEKAILDASTAFSLLNSAKTPDEKQKAARSIADLIRRL